MTEILNAIVWIVGLIVFAPVIVVVIAGLFGACIVGFAAGCMAMVECLERKGWL